VAGGVGFEP